MIAMKHMSRWVIIVFILSLALNVVGAVNYARDFNRSKSLAAQKVEQDQHKKAVDFLKLFVEKVLKAQNEVAFEDRLKLENAVRNLDDAAVLGVWQAFVDSKKSEDAQANLKSLIGILVDRL